MKTKIFLIILFCLHMYVCGAENSIIDNPELLYQPSSTESILSSSVTIKRTFHNINELTDVLNGMTNISTQILNKTSQRPVSVSVYLDNASLLELLNISTKKLGYTWKLHENKIIFSAILPMVTTSLASSRTELKTITVPVWLLKQQDKTLRNALGKWCAKSGWHLIWNVGVDYPIVVPWTIQASFESAINQVLVSTQATDMPLQAMMYDNNKVIEIYSLLPQH